ncbi:MAG: hypothetical protein V2B18_22865, partial [Pseudomonadota bacterium]
MKLLGFTPAASLESSAKRNPPKSHEASSVVGRRRMKNFRDSRLKLLFDAHQLEGTGPDGLLVSAFWSPHPVLPIQTKDTTHLCDWGNRDKHLRLPLTGWTKIESLSDGRWNWLKPAPAIIPALAGYEN